MPGSPIAPETAAAFVSLLKKDLGQSALPVSNVRDFPNLLARPAFEIYGHFYPPMLTFLWGLTPIVGEVVGKDLLPTYDYLRIATATSAGFTTTDNHASTASRLLSIIATAFRGIWR